MWVTLHSADIFSCIYLKRTNYVENTNIGKKNTNNVKKLKYLVSLAYNMHRMLPKIGFSPKHLHFILDLGY